MKKRANILLTMTASALTLLASQGISASEVTAPAHTQSVSNDEKTDTLVYSATKSLIESFGELSRTAAKLSDTALKLLEAQKNLEKEQQAKSSTTKETTDSNGNNTNKILEDISEEISTISSELQSPYATKEIPDGSPRTINNEVVPEPKDSLNQEFTIEKEGGKYIWIPDADISTVIAVLKGETPKEFSEKKSIDLNEMTLWRGDSIPMALKTKRLGRFDRKLYNWLIYPKGIWHIGLTANYGELSTEDSEFLSLISDVDLKGKIYSIKPSVSYFLRNNLCVGMRLAFTKGEMGINSFKVDIDDDMSFNLHDIKYTADSYSAAVFIQQYFGLSRRGRFAVFNEAELSYGSGSSHFIRPFDGNLRDTRTKTQSLNINYSPGVSIMMMKNAAFNLSFGVFGFHLKNEKQWENGEESGSRFTSGINFRFNIFNINFGVSIII